MLGIAVGAVIALGSAGGAFAGEINGNGDPTPARDNARSLCVFSGLEDFDLEEPVSPGTVQNWGTVPKELRDQVSVHGAAQVDLFGFEEGCNAHLYPNGG